MNKRKERSLHDLYNATPSLAQPKITPVLKGLCRMQGPVDEADCAPWTNMVLSQTNKVLSDCSDKIEKVGITSKSGTCNVCSAPCSSCLHINNLMESRTDEHSGQSCTGIATDDDLSCVSGSNELTKMVASRIRNGNKTGRPCSSELTSIPVKPNHDDTMDCQASSDCMEIKNDTEDCNKNHELQSRGVEFSNKVLTSSSPGDLSGDCNDAVKVENTLTRASKDISLSSDSNSRNLKDMTTLSPEKLLDSSTEPLKSLMMKEVVSDVGCGDPPASAALNSIQKNDDMEVEVHQMDESDDSDMVEQDVNVCDICGDAGREDMLATCSRCCEGAEHTYCMREWMEKVPEGEWLCEECKFEEQMRNQRQDRIGRVDRNVKVNLSSQASIENINSSDVEANKMKHDSNVRFPGKRLRDDADETPASKKPAVDSTVGTPKNPNSSKTVAPSQENSFKSLGRGKLQTGNASGTLRINDTLESPRSPPDPRIQNHRGTFLKSNSFNSLNQKPKVKLVDQVDLQRQKSGKEPSTLRVKEGAFRSIGKSMSFKSTNLGRSESKVKMLSPRLAHIQDIKHTKERSSLDRKSSFKSERPSINSTLANSSSYASRADKKPPSRSELSSLSNPTNNNDTTIGQPEIKPMTLSKSSSFVARRSSGVPGSLGEYKRTSSYTHGALGVPSTTSANQTSPKDVPLPADVAEKPPCNTNGGVTERYPQHRETTNSIDRMREPSGNRVRQGNTNGGRSISCHKCKEIGHLAQSCTANAAVGSSAKVPRDETDSLKAAIEAAVLKKPGGYRKHRAGVQSDELPVSSTGSDIGQDLLSGSGSNKNMSSSIPVPERQAVSRCIASDPLIQEPINSVKQVSMNPVEAYFSAMEEAPTVAVDGKSSLLSMPSKVLAEMPSTKFRAVPEDEPIWLGSFEVWRSGRFLNACDGIYAYLSNCASPKVIEAVNKFKNKIVLNEVPRLSTWPVQFQEFGATEDNIALFFFAKDAESYEKSYRALLEGTMKNDHALKGNLDGVELLIFPSNQIEHFHGWNSSSFLWGVFRGKKENSSQHMPESPRQFCTRDIPPALMSSPESKCSAEIPNISATAGAASTFKVSNSEEIHSLLLSEAATGDCGSERFDADQLNIRKNPNSLSSVPSFGAKSFPNSTSTCLDGGSTSINRIEGESQALLQAGRNDGSRREEMLNVPWNSSLERGVESINTVPGNLYVGTNQTVRIDGGAATHEKMKHIDSGLPVLESGCDDSPVSAAFAQHSGNPERFFFPVDPHPVNGPRFIDKSVPWRMQSLEQDRLYDRVPNLDLALGAESKPLAQVTPPFQVEKVARDVTMDHNVTEATTKAEDDVSASLSLSLSFPFLEKEQKMIKPVRETEPLVSERQHNSSMLFFGSLRDK